MTPPKRIYLPENFARICYEKADNHPTVYHSDEALRAWIDENSHNIGYTKEIRVLAVGVDELLNFLNQES